MVQADPQGRVGDERIGFDAAFAFFADSKGSLLKAFERVIDFLEEDRDFAFGFIGGGEREKPLPAEFELILKNFVADGGHVFVPCRYCIVASFSAIRNGAETRGDIWFG